MTVASNPKNLLTSMCLTTSHEQNTQDLNTIPCGALFPSWGPSISTTCFFLLPWLVCAMAVNLFMAQGSNVFSVCVARLAVRCKAARSELCPPFKFMRCLCCCYC